LNKIISIKCDKCGKEKWKEIRYIKMVGRLPRLQNIETIPKFIPTYCVHCNDGNERYLKAVIRWEFEMMVHTRFIDLAHED